jgi:hypothetical protein
VIAVVVLIFGAWFYGQPGLRKAVVLWRQRQLTSLDVDGGRVVYESDQERAARLRIGSTEYAVDEHGKAGWYPRAWRRFPWAEMVPNWLKPWVSGRAEQALVFSGYLMDGPTRRWAVAHLGVKNHPDGWFTVRGPADENYLTIWLIEPETLGRRASLVTVPAELPFGTYAPGRYRVFAGRAARHNPSAFDFDVESDGGRWTARVELLGGGAMSMGRKTDK